MQIHHDKYRLGLALLKLGRHLVGLCRPGLRQLIAAQNRPAHDAQRSSPQERGGWQKSITPVFLRTTSRSLIAELWRRNDGIMLLFDWG